MTPFSSVLEFYMKEKEIRTYSIAQFCGIDRSNMYKMLNGKRNPASEEVVERIAEYMRLKPVEKSHLMEAYQITMMGYDNYHRRKSVQEFLMSFSEEAAKTEEILRSGYMTVNVDVQELKLSRGAVVNDRQLKHIILSVLNLEMQKPEGKICLLMQPERNYIMDMLAMAGIKRERLSIEHIFCLSNTNDIALDKKDYNLSCLNNILPLFARSICDYKPYCYYDNIVSHNNRFNFLSSMILTSEYAVAFSMEEEYGMLLSDPQTIRQLQTLFYSLKEDASLMACKMDSLEKQLKAFANINFDNIGIGFQQEACLVPMIPTAFLEKYLHRSILEQQLLKENVFQYVSVSGQILEASKSTFIFTEKGIRAFVNSGRISELPESVYYPLEYSDRLVLIRRLMKECEAGKYQMLRPNAPITECKICLYSGMQGGYLLIPNAYGDRIFLELRESGLLNAFRDYFETLDRKYYYSTEETMSILKSLLKKTA